MLKPSITPSPSPYNIPHVLQEQHRRLFARPPKQVHIFRRRVRVENSQGSSDTCDQPSNPTQPIPSTKSLEKGRIMAVGCSVLCEVGRFKILVQAPRSFFRLECDGGLFGELVGIDEPGQGNAAWWGDVLFTIFWEDDHGD